MKYFTFVILVGILTSCDIIPDLPRDNVLDGENDTTFTEGVSVKFSDFEIVSDNNGDKVINKGETVYLRISLTNTGSVAAKSVKAHFSANSTFISQLSPESSISYGDILSKKTQYGQTGYIPDGYSYYTIKFTVSNSTPANTQIPININITDESGNSWTDSFNITVQDTNAQIAYSTHNVISDNNGDGIINKGETVYLKVNLINNGSSKANSVKASFSANSPYISQLSPSTQISYGNISAGGTQYGQTGYVPDGYSYYTIKFTVSNSTPTNTQIPINIKITDESGNNWTDSFNITVQDTNAQIAYSTHSVVSDNNKDGIINKGETVYLRVNLINNGSSKANSVKASFSANSPYISQLSPSTQISYGNISASSTQYGQTGYVPDGYSYYTIKFTASSSTPANTQVPIEINITDESSNVWKDSFIITIY